MRILRTLLIVPAVAVMLIGSSAAGRAVEPVVDSCVADGNTDTDNNALHADKDTQVAATVNEDQEANDGERTADQGNGQCGPDEHGEVHDQVAGPGTHNANDDGNKDN